MLKWQQGSGWEKRWTELLLLMCWMDSRRLLTGERNLITKIGIDDLSKVSNIQYNMSM